MVEDAISVSQMSEDMSLRVAGSVKVFTSKDSVTQGVLIILKVFKVSEPLLSISDSMADVEYV